MGAEDFASLPKIKDVNVSTSHPSLARSLVAAAVACAVTGPARAADEFINLGAPAALQNQATYSVRPADISNDGSVVVGSGYGNTGDDYVDAGFRWTAADGFEDLSGKLPQNDRAAGYGVSDDGKVVVGDYTLPGTYDSRGFHLQGSTVKVIEPLEGGTFVRVSGVSGDGKIVVGYTGNNNELAAFRWDSATGTMAALGNLGGGAQAMATNGDGSVVVGNSSLEDNAAGFRAFRWTEADGMNSLGLLGTKGSSSATGVSADGAVVVGYASRASDAGYDHAFRWTAAGGMEDIHGLPGDLSMASGVSGDGKVVVGMAAPEAGKFETSAFRWTEAGGMQTVEQWLSASGVKVGDDVQTREATATNGNGSVVVGTLRSGDAFLARVGSSSSSGGGNNSGGGGDDTSPQTGGGKGGLINVNTFKKTLRRAPLSAGHALRGATLTLQGAHSRPLSRRVAEGQNFFRVAGDWGQDEHSGRDGDTALSEITLGHNFGQFQFNLSAGYASFNDNQGANGKSSNRAGFLHAEWLVPVLAREADSLWLVLSGFHQWGEADLRRGYLNAGAADSSLGSPDSRVWGANITLEWDSLLQWAGIAASPYLTYSHVDSALDAYTETGGGFPAAFGEQSEAVNELRYGLNLERPVATAAKLVATVEGVHRFEDQGANISARVLGAGGFAVQGGGLSYEQDWLRGGAGVEAGLLGGVGSLMANATTEGEAPSWWLAASWRTSF